MNYLAHAYLSFKEPQLLLGNLIGDFVKGKKQFDYPAGVYKGILLHKAIDQFTDTHPATKAAARFFKPTYRLYAPAFIDIVYDHFLAKDATLFPDNALLAFSEQVYQQVDTQVHLAPVRWINMYPYMKSQNWLYNYSTIAGIEKSFGGLAHRAAYLSESAIAFALFQQHYNALSQYYQDFFPQLKKMALNQWEELQKG